MSVMAIVFGVLASGYWIWRPGSNASLPILADNAIWLGQSDIACELRRPECHVGLRGAGGFAPPEKKIKRSFKYERLKK